VSGVTLPFRAEHVGSLLRPKMLTEAYRRRRASAITDQELLAVTEQAIRDAVELQESVGLQGITDGEFWRASYWGHWVNAIDGFSVKPSLFRFGNNAGQEHEFLVAQCTGKLAKAAPISTTEFEFLKGLTGETPKITMPSPSTLHFWRLSETWKGSIYGSDEEFMSDLGAIFRQELADLAALGCRYIQLDEVPLVLLASPDIREQVSGLGSNPADLLDLYVRTTNNVTRNRNGVTAAFHICRGNYKGTWLSEGGYNDVAERVFGEVDVDAFFLEFDTERSGGFEPLRFVPVDKKVVLGLVSSKTPVLEDAEMLKRRVEEAAQFIPMENLCLSPQCGFASTVAGNPLSKDDQKRKLELVVETAETLWGSVD